MRLVASLGGFLGRKGDGEPGTKTLWLGLQELDTATEMWKILTHHSHSPPCVQQKIRVTISSLWERVARSAG